jgi:hypothetical protein
MASTAVAGKKVTGVVAVWTWGTSPCLLHSRLTFVVKRFAQRVSPGGAIRSVSGNPGTASVRVVLTPGAVWAASWRWRNWCGRGGRFQLQPNFRAWPYLAVPTNGVRPPACASRAARSTLVRVPVRLRRCSMADTRVRSGVGGGFMQSLIVGAGFALRAHRGLCLLIRSQVEFSLQQQVARQWVTLVQIAGNPGRRRLGALLSPGGEDAQALWAWRNWCGGSGSFRTLARAGGRTVAGAAFTETPFCQDPGSPSTLAPSFGHN